MTVVFSLLFAIFAGVKKKCYLVIQVVSVDFLCCFKIQNYGYISFQQINTKYIGVTLGPF